jgi:uncharacterized membrane protein
VKSEWLKSFEDKIARIVCSWTFIISQALFIGVWIFINHHFTSIAWDNSSYNILRLILTIESSFIGSIILMTRQRQNEEDRRVALEDFELDKKMSADIKKLKKMAKRKHKPKQIKKLLS